MSQEVLDQPVQQVQSAPTQQTGDLRSMLEAAAQNPEADANFKAQPSNPEAALDESQPKVDKPQSTDKQQQKPAAKPAEKPKQKLKGLDAIKGIDQPEQKTEETPADSTEAQVQTEEMEPQSPQAKRWAELRKIEEEHKRLAPAYEQLKKELEEAKSKPQVPEEINQELEHYRQMYAVEMLDSRPEFQQQVIAPMQEQLNNLKSVADHAQLDATQRQALRQAAENPDSFSRIRAIKQILSATTAIEDPDDVSTLVQFALEASAKYQEAKKTEAQYVRQASEVANSVRGKQAQLSVQQKQQQEKEYQTAHEEMIGTLKAPLQALFDDAEFGPELQESVKSIRPAETPMDKAYQAQAGEILPFAVKLINKLTQERDAARNSLKARDAARPRTTDGGVQQAEQQPQQPDLKHLLSTMAR